MREEFHASGGSIRIRVVGFASFRTSSQERRKPLMHRLAATVLVVAASVSASMPQQAKGTPGTPSSSDIPGARMVSITILYNFGTIPKGVQTMDMWFSVPVEDDTQKIQNRFTYAPYPSKFSQDAQTGNHFMYMEGGPRGGVPMQVRMSFDAQRIESRLAPAAVAAAKTDQGTGQNAMMQRWLGSARGATIDDALKSRAAGIVAGQRTAYDRARAIYDYIILNIGDVEHAELQAEATGGDVAAVLQSQRGTSIDMAAVFVALCRAADIPARNVTGVKIPQRVRQGTITGAHGWAEFWLEGAGWVPVDPAEGKRNPSRRDYYFGSLDPHRLAITRDRDIALIPRQAGGPLTFFSGAYWEGNKQAMPAPAMQIDFTELDTVPTPQTIPLTPRTPKPQG